MDRAVPHLGFWRDFLARTDIADAANRFFATMRIGDSPASADEGVTLILSGAKTATSSLKLAYDADEADLPREGVLSILEDGSGTPRAVVETTEVVVEKFAEVDDAFARAYGEWGGSLKAWRRQCRAFYAPRCRALGKPFSEETELVLERFRVIFTPDGELPPADKRGR